MKTVLTFVHSVLSNFLVRENGESVENNDDHLTLRMADGKSYKLTIEEVSE